MAHPERTIGDACRKTVMAAGGYLIKIRDGGASQTGTPDYLGAYRGVALAWETKVPGRKPTPKQALELRRWARAGAQAAVVTSRDQARELLAAIDESLNSLEQAA